MESSVCDAKFMVFKIHCGRIMRRVFLSVVVFAVNGPQSLVNFCLGLLVYYRLLRSVRNVRRCARAVAR